MAETAGAAGRYAAPGFQTRIGLGQLETGGRLPAPSIRSVGTAVAGRSYSQSDLLDHFGVCDPKVARLFRSSGIRRRFLTLPAPGPDGRPAEESPGDLRDKHQRIALDIGSRAIRTCLERAGLASGNVDYLCCVTTTGLLTPGLSALLLREMELPPSIQRLDIVGMGCHAAMNALTAARAWCVANPGAVAVVLCAEVCSAAYVFDSTMRTAVVNSLFGDGAAAVALSQRPAGGAARGWEGGGGPVPHLLSSAGQVIVSAADAMRYDWDDRQGRLSFFLDPQIPYVIGAHVEEVVDRLLAGAGLRRSAVRHWLVHGGGKKVVDAVRVNLRLTRHDVRHTTAVLRDYGNLSSGSVLFAYERLVEEGTVRAGDYGVIMAMGPGSTIETALVRWEEEA
ncbi:3,5-dihydroxyphenylacetyl-CoA synthase DpgA [Streptomyces sp. NPDC056053]|uniref:3,5-dihydroxyphenylacetyl-CoA synthase DpgA n=1 Tax=Streptomyces sp. NPDC056053 TaxID=3345696 RepID=UPI0035D7F70B